MPKYSTGNPLKTDETENPLEKGRYWFRAVEYEFAQDDGVWVVRSKAGATIEWYDPWAVNPPAKQPREPNDNEWSPHTALARLDTDLARLARRDPTKWEQWEREVLQFYKNWGPLGLWAVPQFRNRTPFTDEGLAPERPVEEGFMAPEISGWFRPPDAGGNRLAHQEPLEFFEDAVEEYQEALKAQQREKEGADPIAATEFVLAAEDMLVYCHPVLRSPWERRVVQKPTGELSVEWARGERWTLAWSFPSLLAFIYLRTVLDVVQDNIGFRQCANQRCRRFFRPEKPNKVYCCRHCQVAERVRRHRAKLLTGRLGPPATGPGVTQNVTETGREPRGNEANGGQPGSPKPA